MWKFLESIWAVRDSIRTILGVCFIICAINCVLVCMSVIPRPESVRPEKFQFLEKRAKS